VTLSPTSKQASTVARLAHVAQYFSFFSLGPCTKGFSEISDFIIHSKLPMNAIIRDAAIIAAPITKNLVLLLVITR
jgi:hypothetical protein